MANNRKTGRFIERPMCIGIFRFTGTGKIFRNRFGNEDNRLFTRVFIGIGGEDLHLLDGR